MRQAGFEPALQAVSFVWEARVLPDWTTGA